MTNPKAPPTFAPLIVESIQVDGSIRTRLDDGNRRDAGGRVVVGRAKPIDPGR